MIPEELMMQVRRLEVRTRRAVNEAFAGEYQSAFRGRGMEFSEVREYQPGDDVRDIDWNVTARAGKPFIKRYVEERELTVVLAVDCSRSESFGSGRRPKAELAAELAGVLSFAAVSTNDKVGLLLFTDKPELHIPPKKGRMHALRMIRETLDFAPTAHGTNIAAAVEQLRVTLRRRAVVFLISDFLDSSGYERPLAALAARHDIVALRIEDPLETKLPRAGLVRFEDAETGATALVDTSSRRVRRKFEAAAIKRQETMQRAMARIGVDYGVIRAGDDYVHTLLALFRAREQRR